MSLASTSRYCSGSELVPALSPIGSGFAQAITDVVLRKRIELLLPVTEATTTLIAECRSQLPATCSLPVPDSKSLQIVNDKSRVIAFALKHSVPVPQMRVVQPGDAIPECTDMRFPIVIKPSRSRVVTESGVISGSVDYASDTEQLHVKLSRLP